MNKATIINLKAVFIYVIMVVDYSASDGHFIHDYGSLVQGSANFSCKELR